MKRYIFILLMAIFCAPLYGDTLGEKALAELSQRIKDLHSYESDLTLEMQGNTIKGSYSVTGEDYHIDLGSVEYFGVGDKRYEVTHKIEEIVVERADAGSNMILNNPTKAFDFVANDFEVLLNQGTILTLKPKAGGVDLDRITIALDPKSQLPKTLLYEADGERVVVTFKGFKSRKSQLEGIDLNKYRHYEVVDLY